MALELNLTLNTNDSIEGVKGKYYPRVEYKGTMSTLQLAKHMSEHTTSFSKGEINGMLTDLVSCIKELCLLGYVVKIEDLGLFKASVEGNGLTLKPGAKVSAGVGQQRTDEELAADITKQQAAISAVKIIMQATGETTMSEMTRAATTSFTSKTKALVKSLTGSDAEDNSLTPDPSLTPNPSPTGEGNLEGEGSENTNPSNGTNSGGSTGGNDGGNTGGNDGGDTGGGNSGGGGFDSGS